MKKLLALLLLSGAAVAQPRYLGPCRLDGASCPPFPRLPYATTLPATCNVGEMYMDSDATSGARFYLCESANSWVVQGGSGTNGLTITATTGTLTIANGKTATLSNTFTLSGTDGSTLAFGAGGTIVYTSNKLSALSATTSSELAGVISDETGSGGALVFASSPTITTPIISGAMVLGASGRSKIDSASDGYITVTNNAASDFTGFRLGGTSSSFPMFKRNSTGIDVRLADDSAYAPLAASTGTFSGVVTGPVGGVSAPTFTFTGDTGLGMYRSSSGVLAFAVSSFNMLTLSNTTATFGVNLSGGNGANLGTSQGTGFPSAYINKAIQGYSEKTLTESSATNVVQFSVASGAAVGGAVQYIVEAADATDRQLRSGRVNWQVVNKSGTETCVVSGNTGLANPTELLDGSSIASSSGTLTYTWGVDTSGTNVCILTLNAVSSLTQTTLRIRYRPDVIGDVTVTPQ